MFKQIEAMMGEETLSVSFIVTKDKDGLSVTVLPKTKEGTDAALSAPLALKGTAEELDAEIVAMLEGFSGHRKSLAEQLADTEAILKAAKEASAKKGQDALKKGAKSSTATAKAPSAPACSAGGGADEDDESDTETAAAETGVAPTSPEPAAAVPSLFA